MEVNRTKVGDSLSFNDPKNHMIQPLFLIFDISLCKLKIVLGLNDGHLLLAR